MPPRLQPGSLQLEEPLQEGSAVFVTLVSIVAAVGGFLFGFDTAVINGALPFLRDTFQLADVQIEIAASSLLVGCVLGVAGAGSLSDRYGRKKILFLAAGLFFLSALGAAIPRTLPEFIAARFVGGLAIGVASMLSPLYIAEIAPARIRGRLVSLNQMAIITGITSSYFISWLLSGMGSSSWRWMFGVAGAPALLFALGILVMPESPRWLVKQGQFEKAGQILARVSGRAQAQREMEEIRETIAQENRSVAQLFQPGLRRPLLIAIALAILQQVTGINTILYYSSLLLLRNHASSAQEALRANVMVGLISFLATLIALWIIDQVGRKSLLLAASGGMGLSLLGLAAALHYTLPQSWVLAMIFAYVAFFSVGMGPAVWVIIAELFPTSVRGRAMGIATVFLWSACLLVTLTFLSLLNTLTTAGTFCLYAVLCLLTFLFTWKTLPETKGKTLEEIEKWWRT